MYLNGSMKAVICEKPFSVSIKDVEVPKPKEGEVLIKVKAVGLSNSDVKVYKGLFPGARYPVILGHQLSGEISSLGKNVKNLKIGDEVIVEPIFPCGKCYLCLDGKYNLCIDNRILGVNINGTLAEYVVAESSKVHPKDKLLPYDQAVLIGDLALAIHAAKRSSISIGDVAVIFGADAIGLLTLQVAKRSGAEVLIIDVDQEKLHLAADLEADYVISPETGNIQELVMAMTKNKGADVIIDCMGTPQTIKQTADLVKKGGKIIIIAWTGHETDPINLTKIVMNEINLMGCINYCAEFQTAINLANTNMLNLSSIISHTYDFYQIPKVLEKMSQDNEITKAIVDLQQSEL